MISLRRARAAARKEFIHVIRDPRSLALALAMPLMLLLLFGYALTLDVDRVPTFVYDQDRSPQSRELIARFQASRYFDVIGFVDDYESIERRIDRDECLLAVVVPPGYSKDLLAGRKAQVQLILDGSDSNTASIAKGYAEALFARYAVEVRSRFVNRQSGVAVRVPAEASLRVWYNSDLESKNYIVPGLIAVILMIIAALLTSLTIAREWEMGTMEQLLSTPIRPAELILGKMSAFFAIGVADTAVAFLVGVLVFDVPFRGSIFFLAAASCLFLCGSLLWGILISAIARSQLLAFQLSLVTSFLPAFLLSGFVYAIENMPRAIQLVTHVVPARYFVVILKGTFLKGIGVSPLWPEVVFLIVYAVAVGVLAERRLKRKIA